MKKISVIRFIKTIKRPLSGGDGDGLEGGGGEGGDGGWGDGFGSSASPPSFYYFHAWL